MVRNGLIQIYTGDGKGKTSAAIGAAMRAYGRGWRVLIVQFLKGWKTGELETIGLLGQRVEVRRCKDVTKFTWQMDETEKAELGMDMDLLMNDAFSELREGKWDMLILDEALGSIATGLLSSKKLEEHLMLRPQDTEIILTGRGASPRMIELADYVSEIVQIKHPYEKGILAREGIEY